VQEAHLIIINQSMNREDIYKPEFYLQKFSFEDHSAVFLEISRYAFYTSSFLDSRIKHESTSFSKFDIDNIKKLINDEESVHQQRISFIFQTAYCCSTLLSRSVDIINKTLVYREPVALHQLAVMKRRKHEVPPQLLKMWDSLADILLNMLRKTWQPQETPIIKTTDSCNNIINDILSMPQSANAVLLYSQLEDFLVSNLKSDGRRKFLRNFLRRSALDLAESSPLREYDISSLSDARAAVYVWMTQIACYAAALRQNSENCVSLDAATLLAEPHACLTELFKHFHIDVDKCEINEIINGPIWHKHAKSQNNELFTHTNRAEEKRRTYNIHKKEIDDAINWCNSFDDWTSVVQLNNPLIS
jgi:hypothetical protein